MFLLQCWGLSSGLHSGWASHWANPWAKELFVPPAAFASAWGEFCQEWGSQHHGNYAYHCIPSHLEPKLSTGHSIHRMMGECDQGWWELSKITCPLLSHSWVFSSLFTLGPEPRCTNALVISPVPGAQYQTHSLKRRGWTHSFLAFKPWLVHTKAEAAWR